MSKLSETSSLLANYDKSTLYTTGMDGEMELELSALLNMLVGKLPFMYLGLQETDCDSVYAFS